MATFAIKTIKTWTDFIDVISSHNERDWTYRGVERAEWPLRTSIERAMLNWEISPYDAAKIEHQMIREFRRRWQGPDHRRVREDTLYCLALMQHHFAPTRLLDCSYSPFVAAAFAMEKGVYDLEHHQKSPAVWCINARWCEQQVRKTAAGTYNVNRGFDWKRNDATFLAMYKMRRVDFDCPTEKFICHENPLDLNERLIIQQGVFLCPGDVGSSFEDNLEAMEGSEIETNVLKLTMTLTKEEAGKFARNLKRMNLSCAALFPGLDGFGRSIAQLIVHYHDLAIQGAGVTSE